jgi:predicted RNA methylase
VQIKERWEFDYDARDVITLICVSGCIPDQKSYQFYPTPEKLSKRVIELASEGATPEMHWLEPSAGTGGIADHVPDDAFLECYEISNLHCEVLKAKGYAQAGQRAITCLDFLQLANDYRGGGYNRVVMNPPFDQGRWLSHIEAAAAVTARGARIVAVLPEGAAKRLQLPGFALQWHGAYSNEFAGTSISVVILVADKQ